MRRAILVLVIGLSAGCAPTGEHWGGDDLAMPVTDRIGLNGPQPLSSNVAKDAPITFVLVRRPSVLKADVEAGLALQAKGANQPVAGVFSWQTMGTSDLIDFKPAAPLTDRTDYVARAEPSGTFRPDSGSWKALFTVGPHLRVLSLLAVTKDLKNYTYVSILFSEPVETATVSGNLSLSSANVNTPFSIAQADVTPERSFTVFLSQPVAITGPLTVRLGVGTRTPGGEPLDPVAFDSPTKNQAGQFEVLLDPTGWKPEQNPGIGWSPTVIYP